MQKDRLRGNVIPVLHVLLDLSILELTTNETLESEDGVLGVDDSLTFRGKTNETFTVLGERNDRRCCPCTLRVLDDS